MFVSCGILDITETTSEEWIAIIDIDGSNLEYICESDGAEPFFVPDLDNPDEELILISYASRVDLMNTDGTDRRTIIDSVGTVFSFSHDKTKMLLNRDGDIYIANVDGTEFQNLTNTPDIWERDPSFSNDTEKIVYSYSLDNTHAHLVIKDLVTNQNSIVFDYQVESSNQNISFSNPFFQNDNQIIYCFKHEDQNEVPYDYRYEIHRVSLNNNSDEIIFDTSRVYHFLYNNDIDLCIIYTEMAAILFDVNSLMILHEFTDTSYHDTYRFSPNANYLTIYRLIYGFIDDVEYYVDTEENDFNQTETKIVGVINRRYPED